MGKKASAPTASPAKPSALVDTRVIYSRAAEQECAAFCKRTGRIIKLLTVQSRRAGMDKEHVQKMVKL